MTDEHAALSEEQPENPAVETAGNAARSAARSAAKIPELSGKLSLPGYPILPRARCRFPGLARSRSTERAQRRLISRVQGPVPRLGLVHLAPVPAP